MARGWIGILVIGGLTVLLGIFMLTLQFCYAAIVGPGGESECIASAPAFLFSGSFTIFLGILMVVSGITTYMGQR